jgi:hypothetical protein
MILCRSDFRDFYWPMLRHLLRVVVEICYCLVAYVSHGFVVGSDVCTP